LINRKITKVKKVSIGGVAKPSKTNLSKIWGKIQGEETSGKGDQRRARNETRQKAKQRRTYQDIMMH
jgi:hypothetical protein